MEITLNELKDLFVCSEKENDLPFLVGHSYLFRTVTHIELGRVVRIIGQFIELEDASWIADTGRYHDLLRDGIFSKDSEVEPYPLYTGVNTQSLVNYAPWPHALPREQK